jgi:hypothetical protein
MAYRRPTPGYRRSTTSSSGRASGYRTGGPRTGSPLRKLIVYALIGGVSLGLMKVVLSVANVLFGLPLPWIKPIPPSPPTPLPPQPAVVDTRYSKVDALVASLPTGSDTTVENLSDSIRKLPGLSETEKVRAAFVWIARNISYDLGRMRETEPHEVLASRSAVCAGFASLMERVCKAMGIECRTVTGIASSGMLSEHPQAEAGHAWNAVKIGNRWSLLDVTWAAHGQEAVDDSFFMAEPEAFICTHFPDAVDWQFLKRDQQWTRSKFDSLPFISPLFFRLGLNLVSHPTRDIRGSKIQLLFGIDPARSNVRLKPSIEDASGKELPAEVQDAVITSNGSVPDEKHWKISLNLDLLPGTSRDTFKLIIFGHEAPLNSGLSMPALVQYQLLK